MITHDKLVNEAKHWLRFTKGCQIVASELHTVLDETPDVIGWHGEISVLVECKTSRADFLADSKKVHRYGSGFGMERWFYAPKGIIDRSDLPKDWGLIERSIIVNGKYQCRQTVKATIRPVDLDLLKRERRILVSIGWRALEACSMLKPFICESHP